MESREARAQRNSEALQAVKQAIVVGAEESYVQGAGPEGKGLEGVQRYPANAEADHGECAVDAGEMDISCKRTLSREPYEVRVSRTALTGGIGETCRKVTRPDPTHSMSHWGSASRATSQCEQHAPERRGARKASPQEAVLG